MKFGEQRRLRDLPERLYFRLFGVADPAHYLHHLYLSRFVESLGNRRPIRILDAGCGAGDHSFWLARRFRDAAVIGVDINRERVDQNREKADRLGISNVCFDCADLADFDLARTFDLIVSIDVLEHIEDRRAALSNLHKALRPDGWAFFHIPTVRVVPTPLSNWLKGFHLWAEREHHDLPTAEAFAQEVRDVGFQVDTVIPTFGRMTGELATSLFALPYENTPVNRIAQLAVSFPCRALVRLDRIKQHVRYAVAVTARSGLSRAPAGAASVDN
jgi:ubiquinone/menaquinone biosynthesis C-methylase UbiE